MNASQRAIPDYQQIMGGYHQFMNPGAYMQQQQQQQQPTQDRAGLPPGQQPPAKTSGGDASQWMTGDATRDPIRQQVYDWMIKAGGTPSGRGSGPTDLEYYVDQVLDPVNKGYGDWAGRIERGIKGTQPGGGGAGPKSNTGDPFYDSIMNAIGGYGNFAETGGFSPQDVQNIRARMVSPIRGVYSQAQQGLEQARRLGGSPGYTAAAAKMARDQAYGLSDATTNAEAAIAQMIQQGKLAGLGGLSQTGEAARGQNLGALSGQSNLYGTSPGLAREFGGQLLQGQQQDIASQQLQQQLANSIMGARQNWTEIPSNFQQGLGNVAGVAGLLGRGVTGLSGLGGWGGIADLLGFGGGGPQYIDPWYGNLPRTRG